MLSTNDAGELFQAMRTAYGQQWKHGGEAIEVWRRALSRFGPKRVMQAATDVLSVHVNHPPTLPQFLAVVDQRKQQNTYLPPPETPRVNAVANLALLRTVIKHNGIEKSQLRLLTKLKNALIEDHGDATITQKFLADLEKQLSDCADRQDKNVRAAESTAAAHRFRVRQGKPAGPSDYRL